MGARNLMDRIVDQLEAASRPLSAGDVRRRLHGDVRHDEVTSRLAILKKRGRVGVVEIANQAITGPRKINAYYVYGGEAEPKLVTDIAQTQQIDDGSSRQVASTEIVGIKAA